jgi:wyosine [tRNA(Phe)-imidazoG37] synthetase (radical SAM superfamily)
MNQNIELIENTLKEMNIKYEKEIITRCFSISSINFFLPYYNSFIELYKKEPYDNKYNSKRLLRISCNFKNKKIKEYMNEYITKLNDKTEFIMLINSYTSDHNLPFW